MTFSEWHLFAARVFRPPGLINEIEVRRAVSAMYYGLFHRLTAAGAAKFAAGGSALEAAVTRAYAHTSMREVCMSYVQASKQPSPRSLNGIAAHPPDPKLVYVADTFVKLQEARHTADYDLAATVSRQDGFDLLRLASRAHQEFGTIEHDSETVVFVAALLLAGRWTRRA